MKTFSVILFSFFQIPGFGQVLLPGQFGTHMPIDTSFYFQSTLTLNCDHGFVFADSAITGYGKWEVKKEKLLLHLDSTNRPELGSVSKSTITFKIEDDRLFCKVIQRRFYIKIPKKYLKAYGKMPRLENYADFKKRYKNNYYMRTSTKICI